MSEGENILDCAVSVSFRRAGLAVEELKKGPVDMDESDDEEAAVSEETEADSN